MKPADELAWRDVSEGVVILDLRTSMYWSLNGSAALLWMALAEGSTPEELSVRLVQEYGIGLESATRDVGEFLTSCQQQDFLEPA